MSVVTSRTHILPYRSDLHIYRGNQDSSYTNRDVYGTHSMYERREHSNGYDDDSTVLGVENNMGSVRIGLTTSGL